MRLPLGSLYVFFFWLPHSWVNVLYQGLVGTDNPLAKISCIVGMFSVSSSVSIDNELAVVLMREIIQKMQVKI